MFIAPNSFWYSFTLCCSFSSDSATITISSANSISYSCTAVILQNPKNILLHFALHLLRAPSNTIEKNSGLSTHPSFRPIFVINSGNSLLCVLTLCCFYIKLVSFLSCLLLFLSSLSFPINHFFLFYQRLFVDQQNICVFLCLYSTVFRLTVSL